MVWARYHALMAQPRLEEAASLLREGHRAGRPGFLAALVRDHAARLSPEERGRLEWTLQPAELADAALALAPIDARISAQLALALLSSRGEEAALLSPHDALDLVFALEAASSRKEAGRVLRALERWLERGDRERALMGGIGALRLGGLRELRALPDDFPTPLRRLLARALDRPGDPDWALQLRARAALEPGQARAALESLAAKAPLLHQLCAEELDAAAPEEATARRPQRRPRRPSPWVIPALALLLWLVDRSCLARSAPTQSTFEEAEFVRECEAPSRSHEP